MEKLEEIIRTVSANNGKTAPAHMDAATRLREDLGFDSFDLAELTVLVEDAFGADIFEDGVVESLGDIMGKLGLVE